MADAGVPSSGSSGFTRILTVQTLLKAAVSSDHHDSL